MDKSKDLGWMNGWGDDKPQEYLDHLKNCGVKYHIGNFVTYPDTVESRGKYNWNCTAHYVCKKCGIEWSVDSSG